MGDLECLCAGPEGAATALPATIMTRAVALRSSDVASMFFAYFVPSTRMGRSVSFSSSAAPGRRALIPLPRQSILESECPSPRPFSSSPFYASYTVQYRKRPLAKLTPSNRLRCMIQQCCSYRSDKSSGRWRPAAHTLALRHNPYRVAPLCLSATRRRLHNLLQKPGS